ncbi:acetyltransferase [Rhodobacterales bacterium HTCC2150]|nr:acetyltransferase [Rhodobacterales bacterium HTCC2150] [Rhodobacteraceae bacterium HTCC2150]
MNKHRVDIISPRDASDIDAIKRLCWEYRDFLFAMGPQFEAMINAFYPVEKYQAVLELLETDHVPPLGTLRLALVDGVPVGCGMIQTFDAETRDAEIKRVFLNEGARGLGVGRKLMDTLIQDCRDLGFNRILMDTGVPLKAATKLYLDLGFKLRDEYQEMPEISKGNVIFFEMAL